MLQVPCDFSNRSRCYYDYIKPDKVITFNWNLNATYFTIVLVMWIMAKVPVFSFKADWKLQFCFCSKLIHVHFTLYDNSLLNRLHFHCSWHYPAIPRAEWRERRRWGWTPFLSIWRFSSVQSGIAFEKNNQQVKTINEYFYTSNLTYIPHLNSINISCRRVRTRDKMYILFFHRKFILYILDQHGILRITANRMNRMIRLFQTPPAHPSVSWHQEWSPPEGHQFG